MSRDPLPLYSSTGRPGYSSVVSADPRRVFARKREHEIDVRFTPVACTVQTSEGLVHAAPGDAIVTGTAGEHWRVSRARFPDRYRPVPPTVAGQAGRYASLPNIMKAKKKPIEEKTPGDYGVDAKPRLELVKTVEPPGRKSGVKVASPAELVAKLKDAGVLG